MNDPQQDPGMAGCRRVRISVIVTNYNYGHYLGPCIASLRAQISPADEIIVVDDGSTDGSRAILQGESGLTVILQENAGQAAAFNAGFAASSGDVLLFLDADDVLYPETLAVIRSLWTSEAAVLCWRLDTINARGEKTGRYDKWVPDLDMAPRLRDGLLLPFMPTSANAFAREAVAWAFPLPAARWKISADAVLVRAGVLSGPMRPIAQVLGGYRIHGANNYYRGADGQALNIHRGLDHIAEAGLDLIDLADRAGRLDPGLRAKLLANALRVRMRAEGMAPDADRLREYMRRFSERARPGGSRTAALAWIASRALPRSNRARQWVTDPSTRPRILQSAIESVAGAELVSARYAETPRRAPHDGPPAEPGMQGALNLPDVLEGPEWERNWGDGSFTLRTRRGWFELERPPGVPHDLRLSLTRQPPYGATITVYGNGLPLGNRHILGDAELLVPLPPAPPGAWRRDRIEIVISDEARPDRLRDRLRQSSERLRVRGVVVTQGGVPGPDGVLPVQGEARFVDLGSILRAPNGAVLDGETLIGPGEKICLALPVLPAPYTLMLRFAPEQAVGTFTLRADGRLLYSGKVGPSQRIDVEIPPELAASTRIELTPGFRPASFLDGPDVAIASLGWLPGRAEALQGVPAITAGETVGAGASRGLWSFLGAGWDLDDRGAAIMSGPDAGLHLAAFAAGTGPDVTLLLDLEPLDAGTNGGGPVVIISRDGEEYASAVLGGRGTVKVTLPAGSADLVVHAAAAGEGGQADTDHGGIVLHGISVAEGAVRLPDLQGGGPGSVAPDLVSTLAALERAEAVGFSISDPPALRERLAAAIAGIAPRAIWHILGESDLSRLAAFGRRLGPWSPPALTGEVTGEGWLRGFAYAVLGGPAQPELAGLKISDVPYLPTSVARAVAQILVADPGPAASRETLRNFQSALVRHLDEVQVWLANEPIGSARWSFATDLLGATRPNALLFSEMDLKPHIEAFGRALETRLLRQGHVLDLPPRSVSSLRTRTRIGILLRHAGPVPETWIAKGLIASLPSGQAEVVVFLTQPTPGEDEAQDLGHARVVSLTGRNVADTVASIRSENLDEMILGAAFHGYMPDAEFAAHRLAPRQITLAAAQYATTGLRNVDEMIIGDLQAPQAARDDCTEKVVVAPGNAQVFEFGPVVQPDPTVREAIRTRLGVGPDTVVLTSGAMQDKIGPEVLDAWIAILARQPDTVLVLYPFAANWKRSYDKADFAARLRVACDDAGVDTSRVIVLPTLGPSGVSDMLAAADLYLVAFPYSGATTTVEALRAGLPMVARAERTQRGQQGAGWLEAYGLRHLVGATTADYVDIAARLAGSASERQEVIRQIREGEGAAQEQSEFRDWLAGHLLGRPEQIDARDRYLFHHIPKTGGSSLRNLLENWFEVIEDYPQPWGHFPLDRPVPDRITAEQIVIGHYWAPDTPLVQRHPDIWADDDWRLISFVRDPLDRALSEYHFERDLRTDHDPAFDPETLEEFLSQERRFYLEQFAATEDTWHEVLDRYWFIGTLERFDDSVAFLADALGKPRPERVPVENATPRSEAPDPDLVAAFREANATDYAIYDEINRRLDRLVGG